MLVVLATDAADPVGSEERVLIEHPLEDAPESFRADDAEQPSALLPRRPHAGHAGREIRTVVDEPLQPPGERGDPGQLTGLERLHRVERDEPHHAPHSQRDAPAIGEVEDVVVEALFLVPEPEGVHRVGDVDEVLPELARHVLVGLIRAGELHRDPQHVEAVHRHPAGPV